MIEDVVGDSGMQIDALNKHPEYWRLEAKHEDDGH